MTSPLITVGIPSYNRPEGLEVAIESILNQSYENIELLISDNASTNPEVKRVLNKYLDIDSRIKVNVNGSNIGASSNFINLLNNAQGDFFMWVADDDYRDKDCLQNLLNIIGNYGSAFSNYCLVSENGNHKEMTVNYSDSILIGENGVVDFLNKPLPSIIYGLHNKKKLLSIVPKTLFDFSDFVIAIKMIDQYGCAFNKKSFLIYLGIGDGYSLKPSNKFIFDPFKYLELLISLIFKYRNLTLILRLFSFIKWCIVLNYSLLFKNGKLESK